MPIGIDPRIDFAFKRVFGAVEHTRVTIHFLNAVLRFDPPISEVELLNPLVGKERSADKLSILDVLALDEAGRRYNIEMQTTLPMDLRPRLLFYNCGNLVSQLPRGSEYATLRPAISIVVVDRLMFPAFADYHLSFRLRCDGHHGLVFSDDLVFHTLELPKFVPPTGQALTDPLEKWLYFLQRAAKMSVEDVARTLGDPAYVEAAGALEMIAKSTEDRQYYEGRAKYLRTQESLLQYAREEGKQEGRQEGRQEGKREGVDMGWRKGVSVGQMAGEIRAMQRFLGEKPTDLDDLLARDPAELVAMQAELQRKLDAQKD